MSSFRRLLSNTFSMFVVQGLQPFLTVALFFVIGRVLGNEEFGRYQLVFQFFSIFQITSSMGLKTLLTREIAQNKEHANKFLLNGVFLGFPAAFINIVVVILSVHLLRYESEIIVGVYFISISLVAAALEEIFSGILTGFEEIRKLAYAWIIFNIIKTVASIIILYAGFGIYGLIWVHVGAKFLLVINVYYYVYKFTGRPQLEIDWVLCKKFMRMGWSLALVAITVSLFWRIDVIILSKMVSDAVVGDFSAAYRIYHFLLMTVRSFSLSFLPMISSFYINRPHDFQSGCTKSIRFMMLIIIPIAVMTTYSSPYIMPILWGSKFNNVIVAQVLQVWVWSIVFFAITEVFSAALIASGRQVVDFSFKTIALVIKVVLIYFLTLKFGAVGPAIATIIAMSILLGLQYMATVPRLFHFRFKSLCLFLLKMLIAIGIMCLPFYLLRNYFFVFGMIGATVAYIGAVYLLKIASEDEMYYFKRMFKKRRKFKESQS